MLPDGWNETTVFDACERVSVGIVVNPSSYYVTSAAGVRTFRSGNVRENRINDENWVFISEDGNRKNKKSILNGGDVLVVRTGFAGTACVLPESYAGSNCIDILFARPKKDALLPEYLCQLTNSELGRRQVLSGQSGLAQKHLNVSSYERMMFWLPPVEEQRKTVAVLSCWDDAISIAERLLENSRKKKKALIHTMLSGKKRLKSFSGITKRQVTPHGSIPADWRYVKVEEVASEFSLKNSRLIEAPVLSCTKHSGLVDSLDYFKKQVFSKDLSTYKVVPRNCFVYATNHIEEGSIGHQDLYDAGLVSPMYTVFKTTADVDDRYLYRLLKTEHFRQIFQAATNSSVDRRGSLRWKDFKKLHLPLPPLKEQTAIASIVDAMDREIELLQKQLEALKAEKIALMQQLLTGKRRVTLSAAAKPSPTKAKSTKPKAVKDRRK